MEKKCVPCLFYECGSLLKEMQNSYNPNSQTSQLKVLTPVIEACLRSRLYEVCKTVMINGEDFRRRLDAFENVPK